MYFLHKYNVSGYFCRKQVVIKISFLFQNAEMMPSCKPFYTHIKQKNYTAQADNWVFTGYVNNRTIKQLN